MELHLWPKFSAISCSSRSSSSGSGTRPSRRAALATSLESRLSEVATRIRVGLCGLRGHTDLLKNENGRLSLACDSCGRETPGWDLRGE